MAYNPNNPNGQATMANSSPVVLASDQSAVPISDNAGSITVDGSVTVSGTVTANAGTGTMNVSVQNASIPVTDNGGSLTVDGTVAATQSGTWDIGTLTSITNTVTVSGTVTANAGTGTMNVSVQNASIPVTDNGSSLTVDGTVTANAGTGTFVVGDGGSSLTVDGTVSVTDGLNIEGDVAHDSPDSGNPVKIGLVAETALTGAVANGDRTNAVADTHGRQLVSHIDDQMQVWKSANYVTQQTGTEIWIPSSASLRIGITYLAISSYATTAGRVILWFGASGDTTYTAGTDQLVWAGSFAPSANSRPGAIISVPFGIYAATADHRLRITTDAAISLDITVYGYEH